MYLRTLFVLLLLYCHFQAYTQEYPDLRYYEAGKINLFYSHETEDNPIFSGVLTNEANTYFGKILEDLDVEVNLLVINPDDWGIYAIKGLIYGMPHFKASENAIVIASDDNMFWSMQMPNFSESESPFKDLFSQAYASGEEGLSGRNFFDLLSIHELSHLWTNKGERAIQRLWLEEVFCNLALHTFIAEKRSELLTGLEVLPSYHATNKDVPMQYTTLESFESDYVKIGMEAPHNYGWYQFRFHHAAGLIYNEGGPDVLKKLWDFLGKYPEKLSDEELEVKLTEEVHPYFEILIKNW